MTSYNKVNGVWSHYHYELATEMLRNEWGYDGLVITDWWMQEGESREFPNLRNDAVRVRWTGGRAATPRRYRRRGSSFRPHVGFLRAIPTA